MSSSDLPDRASLEYLKKLAKERLRELRRTDPDARLSTAQLVVARDHGFPSWRALKAEVDRRRAPTLSEFFAACAAGDVAALRDLLDRDSSLARERNRDGTTGLHLAVRHPDALRLLLEHGAETRGTNALALALDDPNMDAHRVAGPEIRQIAAQIRAVDEVRRIHGLLPFIRLRLARHESLGPAGSPDGIRTRGLRLERAAS